LENKAGLETRHVVWAPPAPPVVAGARARLPRRSPVLLLSCLLALATGLTLVRLSELVTPASPDGGSPGPAAAANAAAVRRFYADVDAVLAGGDPARLDAALAPDFVDHAAAPGRPANRVGLAQQLVALRAVSPTLRLDVADIVAQGDEVVARVVAEHTDPAAFVGIPLPTDWSAWGSIDVFRLADGRIVERWGGDAPAASLQPLPAAALTLPPAAAGLIVTRVAVSPGGIGAAPGTVDPTLYWVETGEPTVTLDSVYAVRAEVTRAADRQDAGTPAAIAPGSTVALAAGDLVRLEDTDYTIRNPGSAPATLVAITTSGSGDPASWHLPGGPAVPATADATTLFDGTRTGGVTTQTLADTRVSALQPGPIVVAVGQATLAAGAGLPVTRMAGMEAAAVETGTGALAIGPGTAWLQRGPASIQIGGTTARVTTLGLEGAALIKNGTTAEIRNIGDAPLTVLVVTITPDRPRVAPPTGSPESDPSVGPGGTSPDPRDDLCGRGLGTAPACAATPVP
jgi:predicted ester cyclase